MSTIASPYGLRPVGTLGSVPYNGGTSRAFRLTANNSIALYLNGPCTLAAGGTQIENTGENLSNCSKPSG